MRTTFAILIAILSAMIFASGRAGLDAAGWGILAGFVAALALAIPTARLLLAAPDLNDLNDLEDIEDIEDDALILPPVRRASIQIIDERPLRLRALPAPSDSCALPAPAALAPRNQRLTRTDLIGLQYMTEDEADRRMAELGACAVPATVPAMHADPGAVLVAIYFQRDYARVLAAGPDLYDLLERCIADERVRALFIFDRSRIYGGSLIFDWYRPAPGVRWVEW